MRSAASLEALAFDDVVFKVNPKRAYLRHSPESAYRALSSSALEATIEGALFAHHRS
ncbi:hypothetical protein [Sphingomonas sp.]|uniref:hypothetical protein n=1 Tax=Sphingomonas sp. TaxID=28214 RepID=UPI0035A88EA2